MKLVVDANILIAELLRRRGRELLRNPQLELYFAEKTREETEYELRKRVNIIVSQERLSESAGRAQIETGIDIINTQITLMPISFYAPLEAEARKRIPRDPNDWEIVALALALPGAIWTEDYDFLGCGCPTWTTETLMLQLQ